MSNYTGSDIRGDIQEKTVYDPEANQEKTRNFQRGIVQSPTQPHIITLQPPLASLSKIADSSLDAIAAIPSPGTVFIYKAKKKKKKFPGVSEKFITDFNSFRGQESFIKKAKKMMAENRVLGGLAPPPSNQQSFIDIPSARQNFFLLATLSNYDLKMEAMDNLLLLLERDELKRETAFDLVSLAINIMKQMDGELIQTQPIDVQVKICRIYGTIGELIIRHYGKGHLGGVTKELKTQLLQTARTLQDLNKQEDPLLHFNVEFALEGVLRLKDNRKQLFELFERIFNGFLVATALYAQDSYTLSNHLEDTFSGLDLRVKNAWYDAALLFNELAKEANNDPVKFVILQAFVGAIYKSLDWKFLYNVIQKYSEMAIRSPNRQVRKLAMEGVVKNPEKFPGLRQFVDMNKFWSKLNIRPLVHFEKPAFKSRNATIREACIKSLIEIYNKAPERKSRERAKKLLLERKVEEKKKRIKMLLDNFSATGQSKRPRSQELALKTLPPSKTTPVKSDEINSTPEYVEDAQLVSDDLPDQNVQKVAERILYSMRSSQEDSYGLSSPNSSPLAMSNKAASHVPSADSKMLIQETSNRLETLVGISKRLSLCLGVESETLLPKLTNNESITCVDKKGLRFTCEGLSLLGEIILENETVSTLNLKNCIIEPFALPELFQALQNSKIKTLNLETLRLTLSDCRAIAELIKQKKDIQLILSSSKIYCTVGNFLYGSGNLKLANSLFAQAIDLIPPGKIAKKYGDLYYKYGQSLLRGFAKYDNAKSQFLLAAENDPSHWKAAFALAKLYYEHDEQFEAKNWAKKAAALRSDNVLVSTFLQKIEEEALEKNGMRP